MLGAAQGAYCLAQEKGESLCFLQGDLGLSKRGANAGSDHSLLIMPAPEQINKCDYL